MVVGFGGAGVCAAIEAKEQGADVIALDRFEGGGATAFSGGIIYAAGTRWQAEAGITDSLEDMYKYLALEVGNVVGSALLRRYCMESAGHLDWLASHGVPFAGKAFLEKTGYPPDGYYLYYSGNETVADYREVATPAPRGHRPVGTGMTGYVLFGALDRAARTLGVRVIPHAPVTRLVVDGNGGVLGVEIRRLSSSAIKDHQACYRRAVPMVPFKGDAFEKAQRRARQIEQDQGARLFIRARHGVVLSTGGFVNNIEMLEKHAPLFARNYRALLRLGSLGCDGSGIAMGQSVGGAADRLGQMLVARNIAPPNAMLEGIFVNQRGQRFINESSYSGFIGLAIAEQPNGAAWLVMDQKTMLQAIRQALFSGWLLFKFNGGPMLLNILFGGTKRAVSLERLAKKCRMNPVGLSKTVADYNRSCESTSDDKFHKSKEYLRALKSGPFYAVNAAIANRFSFTMLFTVGGLVTDEETGMVLRPDGKPINGLYAAGRAAVGLCSNNYISGLSIADCVFSGRRAGRHAAKQSMAAR